MYEIAYLIFIVIVAGGIYELYLDHKKKVEEQREKELLKQRIKKLEKEDDEKS